MDQKDQRVRIPKQAMPDRAVETRGRATFPGGVHPRENKHFSQHQPIEVMEAPEMVVLPMSQHIGAICEPTVAKRDTVEAGQVIGKSDAFVSAPIHSPVKGTVKDIKLASHPVLGRVQSVYIETDLTDGNQKKLPPAEKFNNDFDAQSYDPEAILSAIRDCGLVGLGGAGFPTRVKLEKNPNKPFEVIIVNACECEPFITCDYRVMMEWVWQILAGVQLISRATDCCKVLIGIEDNKPDAIRHLARSAAKAAKPTGAIIEVVPVKTKYPQGGERQLIRALTGKVVPTGGIPPMVGVVAVNVATCAAVAEAVVLDKPLTHRVVTVTGKAIARPGNVYVPLGTPVENVLEFCGGLTDSAARVLLGGPMMGFAIADLSTPVTKTGGAITVLSKEDVTRAKYARRVTPCIRCGRCVDVCPEGLNPTKIAHAVKKGMNDLADAYYMSACIECGCCSFVCPANIELTGYIKTGKTLKARAKKKMPK